MSKFIVIDWEEVSLLLARRLFMTDYMEKFRGYSFYTLERDLKASEISSANDT